MNRMKQEYNEKIAPALVKELNLSNIMQVPKVKKVVINSGIGPFRDSREAVESFVEELSNIAGQKVYPREARLSESGFKIRKGEVVGYAATLRGDRMWAFLDKLINVALPRVRDFRGLSTKSFDAAGNYSIGITEHVIFPEVNPNTTKGMRNLQVTIVMESSNPEKSKLLLKELGMPFKKEVTKEDK